MDVLRQVDEWPAVAMAVGVVGRGGELGARGRRDRVFRFASVTKLLTATRASSLRRRT